MPTSTKSLRQNYRGISAEQRRAGRRRQLIEAAIAVYGRTGFRNATVKSVCEGAGLTERYFYESFPNAPALLVAACRHVTAEVSACVRGAGELTAGVGAERARAILSTWFDVLSRDPVAARLFLIEAAAADGEVATILDQAMADLVDLLEDAWGAEFGASDIMLKTGIAGGLTHMARAWVLVDCNGDRDALIAAALRLSLVVAPMSYPTD